MVVVEVVGAVVVVEVGIVVVLEVVTVVAVVERISYMNDEDEN